MNTQTLDTLRQLLQHIKDATDSESSASDGTPTEDPARLSSEPSDSSSPVPEVPQEATAFPLYHSFCFQETVVAAQEYPAFKCEAPSRASEEQQPVVQPQRKLNAEFTAEPAVAERICSFLGNSDLLSLRNVCKSFRKPVLTTLLRRSLHEHTFEAEEWEALLNYQLVSRRQSDTFRLHSQCNIEQESQHSRDLDRTFLTEETEQAEGQARLDRVLRALSFNFEYFQGLNYISAAFLTRYPEDFSYWCVRYLMWKVGYFPTQLSLFRSHIDTLDSIIERQLPAVHQHLKHNDVELQYFATRWLLTLFSYDTDLQLMLRLWRLVCLTDASLLLCFTLVLLTKLQSSILDCDQEGLNELLKFGLKAEVDRLDRQELLEGSVRIYIENFIDPLSMGYDLDLEMDEGVHHYPTTAGVTHETGVSFCLRC